MELRPVEAGDVEELTRLHGLPEVRRWWGDPDPGWPFEDPTPTRFVIDVDGRIAGFIQYWEESDPSYRHAGIDLFLDPALHNRGLGTEAVRRVLALLRERGHHRVTIEPAAHNAAAIRCYEKAGFRPVGLLRRYERDVDGDAWHDGLLMELLLTDA